MSTISSRRDSSRIALTVALFHFRFIWGAISLFVCVYVYYVIPELKGRTLEQIDHMYDVGVPARKMGTYVIDQDALPTARQPSIGEELVDEKNEKAGAELGHVERL